MIEQNFIDLNGFDWLEKNQSSNSLSSNVTGFKWMKDNDHKI